uniref:Uncharacterized protein n=1 Tax=Arundo donax TaxID=35708 RepID=A0A0A8ZM51_ARUDO
MATPICAITVTLPSPLHRRQLSLEIARPSSALLRLISSLILCVECNDCWRFKIETSRYG